MNYELFQPMDKRKSPIQNIFRNRDMKDDIQSIEEYLTPTENVILSLDTIDNLSDGAALFMKHVSANSNALLVVDEDCDGYTSSALFYNYFNRLFPAYVQNHIRYVVHPGKAHGIPLEEVTDDIKLVIAPDSSSNEYSIHEELKERGVDILVIDHHLAPEASKYACVINNQLCNYENKTLSGVGMVWKFCSYFDKLMNLNLANEFLDLAALGIIADVMDLRQLETRWIIVNGMDNINNPFIKAMVNKESYFIKDELNPHKVAFYLVPGINAVTRVGSIEEKMVLFESMLETKAYEQIPSTKRGEKGKLETRVEQSCRNCTNLRNKQNRSRDTIIQEIEELMAEKNLLDNKILVVKVRNPVNVGITGLVANIIANRYQRPTLILNRREYIKGEVTWEGSGRNYNYSPIDNLKGFLYNTGLVMYAEGHGSAFGVGIKDENFDNFIETTNKLLENTDFSYKYLVDLEYDINDINGKIIEDIASYKNIWGEGIKEPLILIKNVPVVKENLFLFKEKVLKIENQNSDISFVNLRSNPEQYNELYSEMGIVTINIIGTCSINDYDYKGQIEITDYEIVRKADY